jgi:hypothetical protein
MSKYIPSNRPIAPEFTSQMISDTGDRLNEAAFIMNQTIESLNSAYGQEIPALEPSGSGFSTGGVNDKSLITTLEAISNLDLNTTGYSYRGPDPRTITGAAYAAIADIERADSSRDEAIESRTNSEIIIGDGITSGGSLTARQYVQERLDSALRFLQLDHLVNLRNSFQ